MKFQDGTCAIINLSSLTPDELFKLCESAISWVENESPSSDGEHIDKAKQILELKKILGVILK